MRTTTVSNLFSVAVVAVLGLLGRHGTQYNLDANGLRSYLGSQRDAILGALAALPAGLGQGLARLATGTTAALLRQPQLLPRLAEIARCLCGLSKRPPVLNSRIVRY